MANDFLGQILGSVLGGGGGLGGGSAGGLGGMLGGLLGRDAGSGSAQGGVAGQTRGGSLLDGKGAALTAMLIPLAMQWVQRNGGISGVLERFKQKGYSQQAASWVSTGANEPLPPQAIGEVVGDDELSRLSQQLGVGREEVAGGMAQILPEVVNRITPQGSVPHDSDDMLSRGISALENLLKPAQGR